MNTKFLRIISIVVPLVLGIMVLAGWLAAMPAQAAPAAAPTVGLVLNTDLEDIFDQMAYDGLMRASDELGVFSATTYTPATPADYLAMVQACATDGNDLCIGVGYMSMDAISQTASIYTGTLFASIDAEFNQYSPNLRGVIFAEDQAGYLAGTLAGMMTQSDVIGGVGGWPIPAVQRFLDGYQHGAACANPAATAIITYTNSFVDPDLGAVTAQEMIGKGADVIFAAAGGTGNGAVLTATQSGVWAIGVDADQWISLFESGAVDGSEFLLSSAMKRIDQGVYLTIQDFLSSQFTSGTVVYSLSEDGVGLAPFHEAQGSVPQEMRAMLVMVTRGLQEGWLTTDGPCVVRYYQLMPNVLRGGVQ